MTNAEYEEIGREAVRLWSLAGENGGTMSKFGRDIDRLIRVGPEKALEMRELAAEYRRSG